MTIGIKLNSLACSCEIFAWCYFYFFTIEHEQKPTVYGLAVLQFAFGLKCVRVCNKIFLKYILSRDRSYAQFSRFQLIFFSQPRSSGFFSVRFSGFSGIIEASSFRVIEVNGSFIRVEARERVYCLTFPSVFTF